MVDTFTKEKRSAIMATIKSTGNKDTEMRLIQIFRRNGINGWRRRLPIIGKPDFVFSKQKIAIFVDGCFWHACPDHFRMPASNLEYWSAKIARNQNRDKVVTLTLAHSGYKVLRLWQHELRDEKKVVKRVQAALKKAAKQQAKDINVSDCD